MTRDDTPAGSKMVLAAWGVLLLGALGLALLVDRLSGLTVIGRDVAFTRAVGLEASVAPLPFAIGAVLLVLAYGTGVRALARPSEHTLRDALATSALVLGLVVVSITLMLPAPLPPDAVLVRADVRAAFVAPVVLGRLGTWAIASTTIAPAFALLRLGGIRALVVTPLLVWLLTWGVLAWEALALWPTRSPFSEWRFLGVVWSDAVELPRLPHAPWIVGVLVTLGLFLGAIRARRP